MQSRNFRLQKVGDIQWLETNYQFQNIAFSLDELIVLDASRENKSIVNFSSIVRRLSDNVFIPVSAGGGIRSMDDAEVLFNNGADKIVLNYALINNPELVCNLVNKYGSQSVVASIDYKIVSDVPEVYLLDATKKINMSLLDYIHYVESLKVGEIYLNSIDKDGTGFGYDFDTINLIKKHIKIPLIIAGGAGNELHLLEGLKLDRVNAVATANLFNFIGDSLPNARKKIINEGMNIASWL